MEIRTGSRNSLEATPESIGLIAGNGSYPRVFAAAARRSGVTHLAAAAFIDETDPVLEESVDVLEWMRVGQLGKMIKFFKAQGIAEAVMVGQISPGNLYELRPDMRTLLMIGKLKKRNAESIFGGIADELLKDGIALLPATTFLEDLLPEPGLVCGPKIDKKQLADAEFGFGIAKETSRLDIGQTVIVKRGTVLAVEAFEGTNEAMRRGGALGKGEATMVKVAKPDQDFRFDVPVVGPATVEAATESGVNLIVIEARRTLLLERESLETQCRESGISIYAMSDE